jgi:hypothetical protein
MTLMASMPPLTIIIQGLAVDTRHDISRAVARFFVVAYTRFNQFANPLSV